MTHMNEYIHQTYFMKKNIVSACESLTL